MSDEAFNATIKSPSRGAGSGKSVSQLMRSGPPCSRTTAAFILKLHSFRDLLFQHALVDLVGAGQQHLVDEEHAAWVLIGRRIGKREALHRLLVELCYIGSHVVCDRLVALDLVM